MRLRIISIDQASVNTGWAVFQDGVYKESGVISLKGKDWTDTDIRLNEMIKQIFHVINEAMPDLVVMEDVYKQANQASFKLLSRLQGAIMGFCLEYDYGLYIMAPTVWRSCLGFNQGKTIKRNSLKIQSQEYAVKRCGKKLS